MILDWSYNYHDNSIYNSKLHPNNNQTQGRKKKKKNLSAVTKTYICTRTHADS